MATRPSRKSHLGHKAEKKAKSKHVAWVPWVEVPPVEPIHCEPIEKPPKQRKQPDKPVCKQTKFYRTADEHRAYLEQDVVPILMEGLLSVAREQPNDPISFLANFWGHDKQKCDIALPENLL